MEEASSATACPSSMAASEGGLHVNDDAAEANATFLQACRHGRRGISVRNQLSGLDDAERWDRLRATDADGNTALYIAIIYDNPNVASVLLEFEETDLMHKNKRGYCALSLAARSRRPFVVSAVLHRLLSIEQLDRGELVCCGGRRTR